MGVILATGFRKLSSSQKRTYVQVDDTPNTDSDDDEEPQEKTTKKTRNVTRRKKRKTGKLGTVPRSSRFINTSPQVSIVKSRVTIDLTHLDPDEVLERVEREKSTIASSSKNEEEKQAEVEERNYIQTCLNALKGSDKKLFLQRLQRLNNVVGIKLEGLESCVKELLEKVGILTIW